MLLIRHKFQDFFFLIKSSLLLNTRENTGIVRAHVSTCLRLRLLCALCAHFQQHITFYHPGFFARHIPSFRLSIMLQRFQLTLTKEANDGLDTLSRDHDPKGAFSFLSKLDNDRKLRVLEIWTRCSVSGISLRNVSCFFLL